MQWVLSVMRCLNKYIVKYVACANTPVSLAYLKHTQNTMLTDDAVHSLLVLFTPGVFQAWQTGAHPIVSTIGLLLNTPKSLKLKVNHLLINFFFLLSMCSGLKNTKTHFAQSGLENGIGTIKLSWQRDIKTWKDYLKTIDCKTCCHLNLF